MSMNEKERKSWLLWSIISVQYTCVATPARIDTLLSLPKNWLMRSLAKHLIVFVLKVESLFPPFQLFVLK